MSLPHGTRCRPGHVGVAVRSRDHVQTGAARGLSDVDERGFDLAEGRERSMWQETRRMEVVFSERPRH